MTPLSLCLLLLSVPAIRAEEKWGVPEEDNVAILTTKNFNDFVKDNKYVFVKFYAPWCGHCKSMAPAYAKLAKRFKEANPAIPIAKVDATVENELASKFGVKGFPTLKFFVNGNPVDYNAGREEEAMYDWILKKTGPPATEITDASKLEELIKSDMSVLYILPKEDKEALQTFEAAALGIEAIKFHYAFDHSFASKFGTDKKYVLAFFRLFDDGLKKLESNKHLTETEITEFLEQWRNPFCATFNQASAERIFGGQKEAIFFFSENHESEQAKNFKNAAKTHSKDIIFSISKIKSDLGQRLSEFIGITEKDENAIRVVKFVGGNLQKYKCNEKAEKCVEDFKNNKLNPYFKSEAVPQSQDGPVTVVVGDNFKEIVIDSDKHVLIEGYAPWCGHCKKLAPIYDELGTKLKGNKDITIAKMDAASNEYPGFDVKGFPTIMFYKKGEKTRPKTFEGDRTLEGFLNYLSKETGITLDDGAKTTETEL